MTAELTPDAVAENDQAAARAREDLDCHVGSARKTLAQGDDETEALAVIAVTLIDAEDVFRRDRLASLLAAALVRLAKGEAAAEARGRARAVAQLRDDATLHSRLAEVAANIKLPWTRTTTEPAVDPADHAEFAAAATLYATAAADCLEAQGATP